MFIDYFYILFILLETKIKLIVIECKHIPLYLRKYAIFNIKKITLM